MKSQTTVLFLITLLYGLAEGGRLDEIIMKECTKILLPSIKLGCMTVTEPQVSNDIEHCIRTIKNEDLKQKFLDKIAQYADRISEFCQPDGTPIMDNIWRAVYQEKEEFMKEDHKEKYIDAVPYKDCLLKLFKKYNIKVEPLVEPTPTPAP